MQSRLEQAVKLGQRQFFCWLGSDLLAVNSDLICLRIYGKHRRAVVPYHILLADTAAAVYRDNRFSSPYASLIPASKAAWETKVRHASCLLFRERQTSADSRPAVSSGSKRWRLPFRSDDHTAFDDHIRFGAEESRIPEHEISKFSLFDRADILGDTVGDGRVDRIFAI